MKKKNQSRQVRQVLFAVRRYLLFFLIMSFVITCCMLMFFHNMTELPDLFLEREAIERAAKLTFGNILFLTLVCTAADALQRKLTVERPVKRIVLASKKIMQGDFSVRIEPLHDKDSLDGFDTIIDCFNKMAEELSGIEMLRTDFISNVSHELKTPLAVIQNYGTMLQQPDLPEEKRLEYARTVTDASRRLADLISNILKLNKLENQQIYPQKQNYNLGEQLCECLLSFENAWEDKEIEIVTDLEEDVYVENDEELLTLVWNNLFSNAIKFTEPKGTVSLCLKTEGDMAVVQISDTGCGIAPEVGEHIFEKFYQGDTSHATQGNGLGLALVKRVITIVGGDISVESQVGVGSAFTVKIRRAEHETVPKNTV